MNLATRATVAGEIQKTILTKISAVKKDSFRSNYTLEAATQLIEVWGAILDNKKLTWWDDADGARFLQEIFPPDHLLWHWVQLKESTPWGKSIELGTVFSFKVPSLSEPKTLVFSHPSKRTFKEIIHWQGNEFLRAELDAPLEAFKRREFEIYRNQRDHQHWGLRFIWWEDGGRKNDKFQGADFKNLSEVLRLGIQWLVPGQNTSEELQQVSQKIIKTFKVKQTVATPSSTTPSDG